MKRMNNQLIDNINEKGFFFDKFTPSESFKKNVFLTNYPSDVVIEEVKRILKKFDIIVSNIEVTYEDITKDQSLSLHTHLIGSSCQVLIWVPENNDFEGRDFLYGKKEFLIKKFRPKFGDICFMKTNDLSFIHGVSPLLSNSFIRTIVINVNFSNERNAHLTVTKEFKEI